ncbi:MAG TPA: effector binding domain-containing protein [Candidatus Limiplasma sp.]|nr:effector binding domain-containing protein [Candidatus Limiplasma sp.]HRX07627.1 effector binding domain-containing protein [Candidatus Limiplasma sp.]
MNPLQAVGTVSKTLGISSRMLRYYEQIGLIESRRMKDYAYRVYDEDTVLRLRQIIILRKLRVPVKQIQEIFANRDAVSIVQIFERSIRELDEQQITAISTVKAILNHLVHELHEKANMDLQLAYLKDSSVFAIVDSLSFPKNTLQEETSMEDLNKANEALSKLDDKNVRIVYLPPMTVAASYASGEFEWGVGPEATSKIEQFVWDSGLLDIKPDARGMGFDCSSDDLMVNVEGTATAYEAWVSIPDDMGVPAPLIKKSFGGGLYAAHVLRDWNFQADWRLLTEWAKANEKYEADAGRPCLEEILNYKNLMQNGAKMEDTQLDLLLPIKLRQEV